MKNFITKYKVKILLTLFFAFILLILNNNVFAFTFTCDDIEYNIDLPSNFDIEAHPDFVIKKVVSGSGIFQLYYPASDYDLPFIYYSSGDPSGIKYNKKGTTTNGQWNYYVYYSDSTWSSLKTTGQNTITYKANGTQEGYVAYSTVDIYDTSGTLFFQKTPLVETPETPEEIPETPKAGTLQEIMAQLEKEAVLKEIVALLPVILSVLASLIALRKALKMLSDFLRAS